MAQDSFLRKSVKVKSDAKKEQASLLDMSEGDSELLMSLASALFPNSHSQFVKLMR